MDQDSRDSCSNIAALNGRFTGGAKAGKAASNDQRLQTPSSSGPPQTLHCHWSCGTFTSCSPCAQPKECNNKCDDDTDNTTLTCPIKEEFGEHECGFSNELTEDDLVSANITRVENNKQPLQKLYWLEDNQHMLVAAPRDRVIKPRSSPVRLMAVTVNENYLENSRDNDAIYEQEDSDDDELELTRHPIQTDSESDSTEPTSGSPNQQPQAGLRSRGYMQTIGSTIQAGTGPAVVQLQIRPEICR